MEAPERDMAAISTANPDTLLLQENVEAFIFHSFPLSTFLEGSSKPKSLVAAFARTRVFSASVRILASAATILKPPLAFRPSSSKSAGRLRPEEVDANT